MKTTVSLLNKDFKLLDNKRDRYLFIVICFVFAVLFINIFVPFNINRWGSDSGFVEFMRLSSYGAIVAVVFLFTQFPLRKWFKTNHFKIKSYILWLVIEICLISLVYIFLYGNPFGNFYNDFIFSIKYTALGILLPYSFSMMFINFKNQRKSLKELHEKIEKPVNRDLVNFSDANGKIKFSVQNKDLLLLESTDNYITIYYKSENKIQRKLIRTSLKSIEEYLHGYSIIRCHRTYMINISKIESLQKENKQIQLKVEGYDNLIPVSRKYISVISEIIKA